MKSSRTFLVQSLLPIFSDTKIISIIVLRHPYLLNVGVLPTLLSISPSLVVMPSTSLPQKFVEVEPHSVAINYGHFSLGVR